MQQKYYKQKTDRKCGLCLQFDESRQHYISMTNTGKITDHKGTGTNNVL